MSFFGSIFCTFPLRPLNNAFQFLHKEKVKFYASSSSVFIIKHLLLFINQYFCNSTNNLSYSCTLEYREIWLV